MTTLVPAPAAAPAARLVEARKSFPMGQVEVAALQGVSLNILPGEFLVILGPSGSGKTTLLNLLGGLDLPTDGQVVVDGQDVGGLDDRALTRYRRERVGFIFQFFNLIPTLTAAENIEFALELVERDSNRVAERTAELLGQVGLAERSDHFPSRLSGGEQQRVAIARALAKDPPLLLCDEPTGNLDFRTGIRVLKLLRQVTADQGRACVLVTHNSVIGEMADRVVRLRDGLIEQEILHEDPKDPAELRW
ncbi:MAG: macrolide ABC transporter ATP-binding protein [Dehalococcoidia bacterium]|nr:macrolide ABC transporter ATP-binding protein [Dehalococcoidia bacterium]